MEKKFSFELKSVEVVNEPSYDEKETKAFEKVKRNFDINTKIVTPYDRYEYV